MRTCRRLISSSYINLELPSKDFVVSAGDKFLGAFDDADSDQEAAVAAKQDQQLTASSRQFERDGVRHALADHTASCLVTPACGRRCGFTRLKKVDESRAGQFLVSF